MRKARSALVPIVVVGVLVLSSRVLATTVTNTNDSGPGSLRSALATVPDKGTVDFALTACPCTIILTSGDLQITKSLTVKGPGAGVLTVDGNHAWRPFRVGAPYTLPGPGPQKITVEIDGVTMRNGVAGPWPYFSGLNYQGGGIISVSTDLLLRSCIVTGNDAVRGGGGILSAVGNATIIDSVVSNNGAGSGLDMGGGIYFEDNASLTIMGSKISGNHARWAGAGIFCSWYTHSKITNTTISGNLGSDGMGIYVEGHSTLDLANSTVSGNTAGSSAIVNVTSVTTITNSTISGNSIGIFNFNCDCDDYANNTQDSLVSIISSTIYGNRSGIYTENAGIEKFRTITTLRNSIVAGNADSDVLSRFDPGYESAGYNIIGNAGAETVFNRSGDQTGTLSSPVDPGLEPLALNGGVTSTHRLKTNSPAIDHGKAFGISIDQRGRQRPNDRADIQNAPGGDGSDIGAVELQVTDLRGVPYDFDGDGRADVSVFRPSDRTWYLNRSTAGFAAIRFGLSTDKVVAADYDGDGKTDIAVYRDGLWYWVNSSSSVVSVVQFGSANDIPQPADLRGDGRADLAVYRAGTWWTLDLSNGQIRAVQYGIAGDVPVSADFDGDGRADLSVFRPSDSKWYVLESGTNSYRVQTFGESGDKMVPGDYDGDGSTDLAVYRPSTGAWWIQKSSDNSVSVTGWGIATDTPVPADYDGDGKTDIAVYRDGVWYIRQSSNGVVSYQYFGVRGDIPVAAMDTR